MHRAQEVLKEVDAMRQYQVNPTKCDCSGALYWLEGDRPRFDIIFQEDVENLNEVAHNRPRAQLVLGIQQENRSGHRRNM